MRSLETAPAERDARGHLRQLLPGLLSVPVLGRLIHIAAALYRSPETRTTIHGIARRQQDLADQTRPNSTDPQHERWPLPPEVQNLLVSLPPTLRQLHRAQHEIPAQFSAEAERLLAQAHLATGKQLAAHGQSLDFIAQQLEAMAYRSDEIVQRLATLATQIEGVSVRQEFIRHELMIQFRYGVGSTPSGQSAPEIVAAEKFAAARQDGVVKPNLGCGHVPLDGYLNVDLRKLPGVDIVTHVDALPVRPGEAAEIMSAHLLEHFPQEQLMRELLPYWKSLLRPGGIFRAVVPDAEAMIAQFCTNRLTYDRCAKSHSAPRTTTATFTTTCSRRTRWRDCWTQQDSAARKSSHELARAAITLSSRSVRATEMSNAHAHFFRRDQYV
ncbi:class I SAM-dependent methyltransferase [Paraburkholderia jirisanensis]